MLLLVLTLSADAQTSTSVLSQGQFYKIAVSEPGIYKLDASFLNGTAGIDLSQTPANKITLWTNGGGVLQQLTTAPRIDDLREVAMHGVGIADGKVDASDYFLFYAEGPDHWTYTPSDGKFHKTKNIYDTQNYYFICVSDRIATAILSRTSLGEGEMTISQFDDYQSIEVDRVNLLGKFRPPGSGQRWFGDEFSTTRQRDYEITFPNIVTAADVLCTMEFAGRCDESTQISAEFNSNTFNASISGVATGEVEADFARIIRLTDVYSATEDRQSIRISYPQISATSSGWLDFIELQARRQLLFNGAPLQFRSIETQDLNSAEYVLSGLSGTEVIWDITDPQRPITQEYFFDGGNGRYAVTSDGLMREFISFLPANNFPTPSPIGVVPNQNLHGIQDADLVILYHPDFVEPALRLAQHRLEHNGYLVETISIDALMNEFAGGGQDATAIRDFARMLKARSPRFRFLLLFGDGSYDMRHFNQDQTDENFIPVFETAESMNPIRSFPSDDYFALLSDDEGKDLKGAIEIAVGRFPVSTPEEANAVVNKIIQYDTNPAMHGDWRLGIAYVADDEDSNQHLQQTEDVANTQMSTHAKYNVRKIYLDAFQQMNTPGGDRYPDVNAAINAAIQQGTLILNYFGHGGPAGWTQERVLGIPDIQSWTNFTRLPLFITATCSFTPYDEPSLESAGEMVFLNPSGGAIGLLTTVRAVYSSSNKRLTSEVFERILLEENGGQLTIGEVMVLAKNSNHQDTVDVNARKFAIIGDASMKLAIPEHDIVITAINGHATGTGTLDTARALEQVRLSGEIRSKQGVKLTQFNGVLTGTIFDKPTKLKTLANDPKSFEKEFETQTKVLFKGSVSVTNGEFSLSFVIPQDISFKYGEGKVSLYATDGSANDAAGMYDDLIIGGSSTGLSDTEGPVIQIFADNENFRSGDETGPNPTMLIKLSDSSGINISGNSIGHDLEGILDDDSRTSFVLNDRYVSTIDDYTRGEVVLPLAELSTGVHTFKVVAWDIANNYSEESIEFKVVENLDDVFVNLRNTPNPFGTSTLFAFEHRLGDGPVNVEIEIFTVTGRLVQRLKAENAVSTGGTIGGIEWNGSGLAGDRILPGAYFYRVQVVSRPGTSAERLYESRFEKLIMMD
ncbi:MAG TPA: type IX secretion system sortase PorU [Saprospiraceae bacterium]|nr:type IX secretion system sortase PorU [Saprospiraceae bacterium]